MAALPHHTNPLMEVEFTNIRRLHANLFTHLHLETAQLGHAFITGTQIYRTAKTIYLSLSRFGYGFGTLRFSPNFKHSVCLPNSVSRLPQSCTSAALYFSIARRGFRFSADKRWCTSGLRPVVYTVSSAHQ